MPPLQPPRNQRIEVRASSARLGMGPITVCEYEYVHNKNKQSPATPTGRRDSPYLFVVNRRLT